MKISDFSDISFLVWIFFFCVFYMHMKYNIIKVWLIYINTCIKICKHLFNEIKWIKKKKNPTIPPNLYPTLPPSLGSYKVELFVCFRLGPNVLYFLFCAITLWIFHIYSDDLILLILFKILLGVGVRIFWHCIVCNLIKGKMRFSWYFLIS